MFDLGEIVEKVLPSAITGVGGFVGAALNFRRRLDDIEKDLKDYKDAIKEELGALKKAWRMEMDSSEEDIQEKLKELDTELKTLDSSFTRYQRASNVDFANAEEMRHFIEEQQRQWQQIQRTLGQIEGLMSRMLPTERQDVPAQQMRLPLTRR